MSTLSVYLRLGRVSNLPTVWTNVLCGMVLAGGPIRPLALLFLVVALSLFYVGGMFLNDYYDRVIDARERPERPIPSGQIPAEEVASIGYAMMGLGLFLVAAGSHVGTGRVASSAVVSGIALGGAIVLYNVWHKGN